MGTRADFYIGKGPESKWIGSIAWDGYPEGIPRDILESKTDVGYTDNVSRFLAGRKDRTLPEQGWPWPWEDSNTTDYAYAFDGEKVTASCFGGFWFDPANRPDDEPETGEKPVFPNIKAIQNVSFGANSGIMFIEMP